MSGIVQRPSAPIRMMRYLIRKIDYPINYFQKHIFRLQTGRRYVADLRGREITKPPPSGRCYFDLSVICQDDAATGIQRVVRSTAGKLAQARQDQAIQPQFIYTFRMRHYLLEVNENGFHKTDEPVKYEPGDTFVGLDFSLDAIWRMRRELREMRQRGVYFWYLVHDFLPLTHPAWFSDSTVLRFRNWIAIIAATADGFFCVSRPVERQLRTLFAERFALTDGFSTEVIPMGGDFLNSRPSTGLPADYDSLLTAMRARPSLLMVGTIEPRKGHADALDALEILWARGADIGLVLVGGSGWKMADFNQRLGSHPEAGHRLRVVGKISDEALDLAYEACTGVLFPSHAEGFGLPVIEALGRGKPVLARGLEVLLAHAGKGVSFFDADATTEALADAIEHWILDESREPARPDLLSTWEQSAKFIERRLGQSALARVDPSRPQAVIRGLSHAK